MSIFVLCSANSYAVMESELFSKTTEHTIQIQGKPIKYKATVGLMPIYNKQHELLATMSYFAYSKVNSKSRPITFVWPGGPGVSSLSSNFLVSGPKAVNLKDGSIQSNMSTWLRFTDLVYIDMVGTGWGRIADKKFQAQIFTPDGDAYTFSEFIKSYLTKTENKSSGVYLAGTSYGGYRAPLVANQLLKNFISINGIILQSPLLKPSYLFFGGYDTNSRY